MGAVATAIPVGGGGRTADGGVSTGTGADIHGVRQHLQSPEQEPGLLCRCRRSSISPLLICLASIHGLLSPQVLFLPIHYAIIFLPCQVMSLKPMLQILLSFLCGLLIHSTLHRHKALALFTHSKFNLKYFWQISQLSSHSWPLSGALHGRTFQGFLPLRVKVLNLPRNITTIMITFPLSVHLPTNPYEKSLHLGSGFSNLSQLYPSEYPTLPYALKKRRSASLCRSNMRNLDNLSCVFPFMFQT